MVVFGPGLDATESWDLAVMEADDEDELRAFTAADPVVTTGTAEFVIGKMPGGFVVLRDDRTTQLIASWSVEL